MKFFVVQPYGRDKGREATVLYEAQSAAEAFTEIDRLTERMRHTGAAPDSIELLVVDDERRIIGRYAH